ncbi:EscU/YscU/HrcU family type III secretion system export apparatus switch protein [Bacillus alveayuensis]|jgi:flagellar biosynthesis protein|uniref:Flagellar biosynthesis protein n=1 Tax=Aeribacillus alveayuensis TaxID=279215 RepID=A0ABT9VLH7_9BACI|nr:EscU/YscU/HrcU family type III secretion system export apparatus switch protein [Bacillus alveayuensis]MDQ0161720.1 flagellar biosynthesis protein [Bacillus alveayuensis]
MNEQKKKKAVALKYDQQKDEAPIVAAKGSGRIAEEIIQLAEEHKIPVQKDEALLELLSEVDVNEKIPEELYKVVAELFAFIYRLDRDVKSP